MSGPSLAVERSLLAAGHQVIAGMDEVGRGALAGPACVGVVAITAPCPPPPVGLRDSKLLSAQRRTGLLEPLGGWGAARALGWASAAEIDRIGIVAALRQAGLRALAALGTPVDAVLLDGSHDWLSAGQLALEFADDAPMVDLPAPAVRPAPAGQPGSAAPDDDPVPFDGTVVTRVKADRDCAAVAAASVLAKCARDARMADLAQRHPGYGWERNMGYGTAEHVAALRRLGASEEHRRSWRLPTCAADGDFPPSRT